MDEQITISPSSVANILESEYILPPKVTKAKKKRIKKELENKKKAAKNQKEADTIQANLIAVEDAQAWNEGSCCQYFNHHRVRFPT